MPRPARRSVAPGPADEVAPDLQVLKPVGQIDFYSRLQAVRKRYLHEGLRQTIEAETFDLATLDRELAKFAAAAHLKRLASFQLRGETFFAVPYLLDNNPYLLGYYRLLYGFSGKSFYDRGPFKRFRRMEDEGRIEDRLRVEVAQLCRSLCATGGMLVERIEQVSPSIVNELQILTLGAQFRGSGNVKLGQDAVDVFFALLRSLLSPYNPKIKGRTLTFLNDSKLSVAARFGSDPDVSVTQQLGSEDRKLLAIELKGGADISNIWNRIGEAEKSHLKAKNKGFNDLWTVTRVDLTTDPAAHRKAMAQSPSTTRFFCLEKIVDATTAEAMTFRQVLGSVMGVRLTP